MDEGTEFYLDWNRDKLIGYERVKYRLDILAMEAGVKAGVEIPAVSIVKRENNVYEIQYGADPDKDLLDSWSGGHHRSRANLNLWRSLKSNIVGGHFEDPKNKICVPVEDIEIRDGLYSDECMRDSLSHLPRDIAEKFCVDHSLDSSKYLSQ